MNNGTHILVETPFKGGVIAAFENEISVWGNGKTLAEYKPDYPNSELITWDEFFEREEKRVVTRFTEISEKDYSTYLEQLPPHKWHDINERFNVFFNPEALTGIYNACHIRDYETGKYYAATKSRFSNDAELLQWILEDIK